MPWAELLFCKIEGNMAIAEIYTNSTIFKSVWFQWCIFLFSVHIFRRFWRRSTKIHTVFIDFLRFSTSWLRCWRNALIYINSATDLFANFFLLDNDSSTYSMATLSDFHPPWRFKVSKSAPESANIVADVRRKQCPV